MPIVAALTAFRTEVATLQGFVAKAFTQDDAGAYLLTPQERSFVVDSAFLRIFIAWEGFLEQAFVSYLLGHPSSAGKTTVRHALPASDQHARSRSNVRGSTHSSYSHASRLAQLLRVTDSCSRNGSSSTKVACEPVG